MEDPFVGERDRTSNAGEKTLAHPDHSCYFLPSVRRASSLTPQTRRNSPISDSGHSAIHRRAHVAPRSVSMPIASASRLWNPTTIAANTAALVLGAMILFGAGSCAELDAQDAAHARKPASTEAATPSSAEAADPHAPAVEAATAPSTEPALDLLSLESSRAERRPRPVQSMDTAPTDSINPAQPTPSDPAPEAVAPGSLPSVQTSPVDRFFEPSPLGLRGWTAAATEKLATADAPSTHASQQLVQIATVVPVPISMGATAQMPYPAPVSTESASSIDPTTLSTARDVPGYIDDETLQSIARLATIVQSAPIPTLAHTPKPEPVPAVVAATEPAIFAPKPLNAEPPAQPFKPIIVDVAAPLTLPFCITQRPLAAPRPPAPAPPTASVALTSRAVTSAAPASPAIPYFLLAAMALAFIATCGMAYLTSASIDSNGTPRRVMTISCRISLAFGTLAVALIGCCRFGAAISTSIGGQISCAVLAVVGATLCIGAGVWLCRAISGPITATLSNMRALASGNLLVTPINSTTRDELGELARSTDKLAASLKDIISEVAISSSEVAVAASELAIGAQGMSAAAGQVSNQCAVAAGDASCTGRLATSGGRSLQQASAELARIDEFVHASTGSVRTLADRGRQIARIVELIDDISDRTHLVALNASIEASKAGPNGRAFAMLADEVRRLAERTQKATEEATATVRGVQDDCTSAAERMTFGAAQIKQSADLAGRAGHDLAEIIRTAGGVSSMIETISTAAEEAGAGAAQSAGAAVQLSARAGDLKAMVDRFRIDTTSFMRHAPATAA